MFLRGVLPYWSYLPSVPILVLFNCYALLASADNGNQAPYTAALINVTLSNPDRSAWHVHDHGRYGQDSPKVAVKGLLLAPLPINGALNMAKIEVSGSLHQACSDKDICSLSREALFEGKFADRLGCDPRTRFQVPPNTKQWIALLQRGNCTFRQKILRAALQNASAVVIYNNVSGEDPVTMTHQGTGDIVTVMITETKVKEILNYLEKNISLIIAIAVGTRPSNKTNGRSSLVFVSILFIVLMIISSAWLIFYFIQKIRYTSARDRNQRRLGDAAKKAVGKLTTRTVKKGDKETDPDFDHCAVCIESYKQNDVVRILPCKHVFHKTCVDPWLSEHCTCPMCKLNILKALGIVTNVPCADNMAFDMERLTRGQLGNRRSVLGDLTSDSSLSLEPLRTSGISQFPQDGELTPRTGEINIAVTSGHFFHRNSLSPRSLVYENDFSSIEPVLDMYDENKT